MPEGTTPLFNNFRTGKPTAVVDAIPAGGITTTMLADNSVNNTKLADMAQATIKGRASGTGTGDPQDLTGTQATVILNNFVGDSGSGGTKGLVPAPAAGDAAAGKFLKADGTFAAITSQGLTLILTQNASNSSTIDFVNGTNGVVLDDTYDFYVLKFASVKPVTDGVGFWLRVGTGAGPTWQADAADYAWGNVDYGGLTLQNNASDSEIELVTANVASGLGNAAGEAANGEISFEDPETTNYHTFRYSVAHKSAGNPFGSIAGSGQYNTAEAITGIRFLMSSGNISSGIFSLYGYKK